MLLTCVTAVFNAIKSGNRGRLVRCVESVARLKVPHEHLIYDGASTDGTVELLLELEARLPGIRVVSEPDIGIYNALNKGVRDAQGTWFYVLGCDDYVDSPQVLDDLIQDKIAGCDVAVGKVRLERGDRLVPCDRFIKNIFWSMPYCHQAVVMRTDIVRRFGGFYEDCRIIGDYGLLIQCHLEAVDIRFFDDCFAVYHEGGISTSSNVGFSETGIVLARRFGFSKQEIEYFMRRRVYPLRRIIPFCVHGDPSLRMASFYMLARWALSFLNKKWRC